MTLTVLNKWIFGGQLCDVWMFFEQMSVTASILNLCMIALDRYWSVLDPLVYAAQRTERRMKIYLVLIWMGAFLITIPPQFISDHKYEVSDGRTVCLATQDITYQMYETIITFFIPYVIVLITYYRIFETVQRISDEDEERTRQVNVTDSDSSSSSLSIDWNRIVKHLKAATLLSFLVLTLTVCWLPFFVLELLEPFIDYQPKLEIIFLWMGYSNSLMNPIVTVLVQREFREPIHQIVCCRCSRLNAAARKVFFHDTFGSVAHS